MISETKEYDMDKDLKLEEKRERKFREFLRVFLRRKLVTISGVFIIFVFFVAIFADLIAPYNPTEQNLMRVLEGPSAAHWLGTDSLGRDVLSRIIYGARISMLVGIISVTLAAILGILLGMISGYLGGIIDAIISRIIDALITFPPIMLALGLGVAFGSGVWTVIGALVLGLTPTFARVMRGQVLSIKESDYIKASEVMGAKKLRIMIKHILPNCISPMIVLITLNLGVTILAEAALSFLGVGITPPTPAWGAMVSEGQRYLINNPILSFAPGMCVLLIVLAFNIVGDGLRDALDPRLRGSL